MNVLAIDYGLKRIGIAIGTTESGIAFPRDIIFNDDHLMSRISEIIDDEAIAKVLVGLPKKQDMSKGEIDQKIREFVYNLEKIFDIQVILIDERYTSKIAKKKLRDVGMKEKEQKKQLDSIAAQVILQEWLDSFNA